MSDIIYEPTSDFLKLVASNSVQVGYDESDANLQRLIELTTDSDVSNRDWATFILSFHDLGTVLVDTPLVRKTLRLRLLDEDPTVQEEALIGLALRKDPTALPQLKEWLQTRPLSSLLLEAAEWFADESLCDLLLSLQPQADEKLRRSWARAWQECQCTAPAAEGQE